MLLKMKKCQTKNMWKKISISKVEKLLIIFKKILHESNDKPNKIWVDNGSKFYYRSLKS